MDKPPFMGQKFWVSLIGIGIGIGCLFGLIKYRESRNALTHTQGELVKLKNQVGTSTGQYGELETQYEDLKTEHDKLKENFAQLEEDRNNVLVQTKELMKDKSRLSDLELQFLELAKKEHQAALDGIESKAAVEQLLAANAGLRTDLDQLRLEKESLETNLSKIQSDYLSSDKLIKEAEATIKDLKEKQGDFNKLKESHEKLKQEHTRLSDDYDKIKKDVRKAPSKFKDLAKENESLTKETADMHYNLGVFYSEKKEYGKALKEFKRTLELNPKDPKAHYNVGYIYAKEYENHEKAIEHFRIYLGLDPADEGADWVRNYIAVRESFDGKILKS